MKRISKLGLAAVTALVLSASVGAGSASASAFVPSGFVANGGAIVPSYPATIRGEAKADTVVSVASTWFACWGFSEELGLPSEESGLNEAISSPTNTLYHSGQNGPCTAEGPIASKSVIEPNGCGTIIHTGVEIAPGEFAATVDIGPNPGASQCGPVRINGSYCDVLIPEQQGITGARLINHSNGEARDSVEVTMNSTVKVLLEGCYGWNPERNALLTSKWEVKAFEEGENQIDLHVDQTGVYMGEGGFEAEEYPVSLFGEQDGGSQHLFSFANRTVKCSDMAFEGEAAGASGSLGLDATYEGCRATILEVDRPADIDMNSCNYVLNAAGTLDVACASEGDGIEARAYNSEADQKAGKPVCVWKIAPQKGVGSVAYSTLGEGSARKIDVDLDLKGLGYARALGGLVSCGSKVNTATYTGGMVLEGAR